MNEVWKPVRGYEGSYEVSDQGRVRSVARTVMRGDGRPHPIRARVLRAPVNSTGYPTVYLSMAGGKRAAKVHRLVAWAFLPPPQPGQQVCHGNGVRTDARAVNLRWGTALENSADRVAHGRSKTVFGERIGCAKLTAAKIRLIRRAKCARHGDLAARFGVSRGHISSLRRGEGWAHLGAEV